MGFSVVLSTEALREDFFKVRNSMFETFEYRLIGIKNRSDHDEAIDLGAQMSRIFKDTCLIQ